MLEVDNFFNVYTVNSRRWTLLGTATKQEVYVL